MATKKQKLRKQHQREKSSKEKVLKLRAKKRAFDKEQHDTFKKQKMIKRIKKQMDGLDLWADEVYEKLPESTLKQLEHNAHILKALEEQHEAQFKERMDRREQFLQAPSPFGGTIKPTVVLNEPTEI
jgi:hypothetical protein